MVHLLHLLLLPPPLLILLSPSTDYSPPQIDQLVDSPSLYADVSLICGSILVTMSAPMQHPNCSRPCSNTQPNLESQLALTASG